MWHANAAHVTTGYGVQTAVFTPRLKRLGHDVAISAVYGISSTRTVWQGMPVYPHGFRHYGGDVITGHAQDFGTDLVLTLLDIWAMDTAELIAAKIPLAHWVPVDTETLSAADKIALGRSECFPIAMSQHGRTCLQDAGFSPFYVPHGIPCGVFAPGGAEARAAARERMGIPLDAFVVGIDAANKDPVRKGFPEQFEAFRVFHARHPDTLLLAHTTPVPASDDGINLGVLAAELGIQNAIRWTDSYKYMTGAYTMADMTVWYQALDLYSGCTYAEGFGLPVLQAQACGVPVAVTDCSAMTELCGAGWLVPGQRWWNPGHTRWWKVPFIHEIAAAYEEAYDGKAAKLAGQAREFALAYDADRVLTQHWEPVLREIGERIGA